MASIVIAACVALSTYINGAILISDIKNFVRSLNNTTKTISNFNLKGVLTVTYNKVTNANKGMIKNNTNNNRNEVELIRVTAMRRSNRIQKLVNKTPTRKIPAIDDMRINLLEERLVKQIF